MNQPLMHVSQPSASESTQNPNAGKPLSNESIKHKQREIFRGHIPELDALRAIGIIVVVLNHTFPESLSYSTAQALKLGWAFMDSFFVMSGFLITGILLDSKAKPDYFKTFYVRRAFRILPLYYLVVGSLLIAIYAFGDYMPTWGSPWWFTIYLGNMPTAIMNEWPSGAGYSFAHLWSLQVEEQFYLLFPLLIRFTTLATLRRVLIAMIPLSLSLRILIYLLWPENLLAQFVFLPCRLDGFALGALIALRYRTDPWSISKSRLTVLAITWIAFTGIISVYGGFEHTKPLIRTFGFSVSSIASAYVIVWLVEHRDSSITAIMRSSVVQHLGKISYGVYLLHVPIAAALVAIFASRFPPGFRSLPALLTVGPLSVILASLSWSYFESPILKLKDRFSSREKLVKSETHHYRKTSSENTPATGFAKLGEDKLTG